MSTQSVEASLLRCDFAMNVQANTSDGAPVSIAATIVVAPLVAGPRTVCFAFPGGGYTKAYFDLRHPELDGPSEAEYHARRGLVFIACDPYGGADSTRLDVSELGLESTAAAVDAAVCDTLGLLRAGRLHDDLPAMEIGAVVGIGHSLGGMQLIAHQARHSRFDAVAVLGWSAVHTTIPTPGQDLAPHSAGPAGAETLDEAWAGPLVDDVSHLRYAYHWDNVSAVLVGEDMGVGFPTRTASVLPAWISDTFPPFAAICMSPGVVAAEAAAIAVPVFIGAGQRDVVPELHAEATAYAASTDVTLVQIPRTAHMHNFSPHRELLWCRLQAWIDELATCLRPLDRD
jgi:hypothetical protein